MRLQSVLVAGIMPVKRNPYTVAMPDYILYSGENFTLWEDAEILSLLELSPVDAD